jgi:hypothetical protein
MEWIDLAQDRNRLRADGMEWIDLAQDRNRLRAVVNTVVSLRVP